jgi:hypothetical protein
MHFYKIKGVTVLFICFLLSFSKVRATTVIPITIYVLDDNNGTWANLATDASLSQMICDVNKIFAGQDDDLLAAINNNTFPNNYLAYVGDAGMRFFIAKIYRYTNVPQGQPMPPNNIVYPPATGVPIYLYNGSFAGIASSSIYNNVLTMIKTFGYNKATISHELGHMYDLCHLNGCGIAGEYTCLSGSDDCCSDTPPSSMTSCNINDGTNMPQNIMQEQPTGCQFFFTTQQRSRMNACITAHHPTWVDNTNCPALQYDWHNSVPTYTLTPTVVYNNPLYQAYIHVDAHLSSCVNGPVSYYYQLRRKDCESYYLGPPVFISDNISSFDIPVHENCNYVIRLIVQYSNGLRNAIEQEFFVPFTQGKVCGCNPGNPDSKPGNTLGLNETTSGFGISNITVYPNPVQKMLNLKNYNNDCSCISYTIMNNLGQFIDNGKANEQGTIDVSKMTSGIYYLRFVNSLTNETKTIQFMKL